MFIPLQQAVINIPPNIWRKYLLSYGRWHRLPSKEWEC